MCRVDAIVPCYNYARYLRQCVESITTQTGVDVRVLIIDDHSTDNTADVARALVAENSRVDYRRHAKNAGHIATYNEGLDWADGDYTLLLSADDMLTPGSLARATALMEKHPQVGFTFGRNIRIDSQGPKTAPAASIDCAACVWQGRAWLETIFKERSRFIDSPEVLVRTRMYKQFGGFRAQLPHTADVELWLRFASQGDVGQLDADQAYYRVHDTNMHGVLAPSVAQSLKHWKAAFDSFFQHNAGEVVDSSALRDVAYTSLASMALSAAYGPSSAADAAMHNELLALAYHTAPRVRTIRGSVAAGYLSGRVREAWGTRMMLGAPAYLFGRVASDSRRLVGLTLSGNGHGAAFEMGRIRAHLSLVAQAWRERFGRPAAADPTCRRHESADDSQGRRSWRPKHCP
jgi:glycosyltransferase involved in cell wall biosynthesis